MTQKKIYLESLGCPKNRVDSEITLGSLLQGGLLPTADPEEADILMVNSCGFVESAKEESIDTILRLAEIKQRKPLVKLAVMGCLTERYRDEIKKEIPDIDYIYGVSDISAITKEFSSNLSSSLPDPDKSRLVEPGSVYAYLKIAEGCSNTCAFCAIPAIRGSFISRAPERIIEEATSIVKTGVKELILVAQDSTLYGADLKMKNGLATLLRRLDAEVPAEWIRVMYMYPSLVTDELLESFAKCDKVVPYFDIPIQHGADSVLARMKRPERNASIRSLIKNIRNRVEGSAIRSTAIVGFPGETEDDFEQLLSLIEDIGFDHFGAFIYSDEEGTSAYDLPNKIPQEIAEERFDRLLTLQNRISADLLSSKIGEMVTVLVDNPDSEEMLLTGRLPTQAPEIDGCVILDDIEADPGQFVELRIESSSDYDLIGKQS